MKVIRQMVIICEFTKNANLTLFERMTYENESIKKTVMAQQD